jgi:hypothetical protein
MRVMSAAARFSSSRWSLVVPGMAFGEQLRHHSRYACVTKSGRDFATLLETSSLVGEEQAASEDAR